MNQWPLRCQRSALTTELIAQLEEVIKYAGQSQARRARLEECGRMTFSGCSLNAPCMQMLSKDDPGFASGGQHLIKDYDNYRIGSINIDRLDE